MEYIFTRDTERLETLTKGEVIELKFARAGSEFEPYKVITDYSQGPSIYKRAIVVNSIDNKLYHLMSSDTVWQGGRKYVTIKGD